jgi:transcriptional regulator with XRE-family HTH domain
MLRDELAGPGEGSWSQARLAEEAGLSRNVVARLEGSFSGSIEVCLTILFFFHQRGYNISWIILPDNSTVTKMAMNDTTKAFDAELVLANLEQLKEVLSKEVDSLIGRLNG